MRETSPNTPITSPPSTHSRKAAHLGACSGIPDLDEPSGTGTKTGYGHPTVGISVGSYATTRIRTHLGSCIGVPDPDVGVFTPADNHRPVRREIDAVYRPLRVFDCEGAYLQDTTSPDHCLQKTCVHPQKHAPNNAYVVGHTLCPCSVKHCHHTIFSDQFQHNACSSPPRARA